MMYLVRST